METIRDVRIQEGNPRAGVVGGPAQALNQEFHTPGTMLKATSLLVFVIGVILLAVGCVTFIVPLMGVGAGVLAFAGLIYVRSTMDERK